jgi:glycosyltransferase involved in cell wall biosynthesis
VVVACVEPTETPDHAFGNTSASGEAEGVEYVYTCGRTAPHGGRVARMLGPVASAIRLVRLGLAVHRRTRLMVVHYYTARSPLWAASAWLTARLTGAVLIGEATEYPFVYESRGFRVRFAEWLNRVFTYRRFDLFVAISTLLVEFFAARVRGSVAVLRIPVLLVRERWSAEPEPIRWTTPVVAYMGNLQNEREVRAVAEVFVLVAKAIPSAAFAVAGPPAGSARLGAILGPAGLTERSGRLTLAGSVAHADVPEFLQGATVLILPRPLGLFSQAGLPTKLADYLASGRPVVSTSVGDVGYYLRDGESAFLVDPGDAELFASRVVEVLRNPELAERIGARGRVVAVREFSCDKHCAALLEAVDRMRRAPRPWLHMPLRLQR